MRRSGATQAKCRHICGPGPYKVLSEFPCLHRSKPQPQLTMCFRRMQRHLHGITSLHITLFPSSRTTASPLIFWKRSSQPVIILTCRGISLRAFLAACAASAALCALGQARCGHVVPGECTELFQSSRWIPQRRSHPRQERGGCRSLQKVQQRENQGAGSRKLELDSRH